MCFHSRELFLFSFLSFNSLNFIQLFQFVFSRLKFMLGMTNIRRPNHTIKNIAARNQRSIYYWFLYFVTFLPWYTQPGGSLVITTINQTALSYAAAIVPGADGAPALVCIRAPTSWFKLHRTQKETASVRNEVLAMGGGWRGGQKAKEGWKVVRN